MSFLTEIIPITIRTGTGTQTVSHVLNPTVQAKAYIFFTADVGGTNSKGLYSFGFDDSLTHVGTGVAAADSFGACTARGLSSNYSLVTEQAQAFFGGYAPRLRGYVSALAVGSCTLTFDLNDTPGAQWYAVMIGGVDTHCSVGVHTSNAPGVETVGFSPVAVITLNASATDQENAGAQIRTGFATPCNTSEGGWGIACGETGNNSKHYQVASIVDAIIDPTSTIGTAPTSQRTIDTWTATGFSVSGATVTNGDFRIGYLAIGGAGVAANLVAVNQKTSTGTHNVTIDAYAPKLALFGSTDSVTSANVSASGLISFGAYDGTNEVAQWFGTLNGAGLDQHSRSTNSACVLMATPTGAAASTVNAQAACTGLTTGNVALNWTTADATAREFYVLVLADGQNNGPCGANPFSGNSITVTKIASPPTSESFTFTTTGGLSPSTFSLADGASRVYSSIANGTYGVTESPQTGWTPSYNVSSGDPHTAIVINSVTQPTVTVTVTNTYRTTTQQLRRYRRFNLPWSDNYNMILKRAELIAQMGVGTSILNPTVTLRFSKDGGQTYPITRTVTLGLQGDYTKRAYTLALGEARNWVCEVYCDDPAYCGWIGFDVDMEKGVS